MIENDRRTFLRMLGGAAAAAGMSESIQRALAIPASHRTGTIADIEHIVILMQENRSFDHYLGTLRGVRGFEDPRAVVLPSGKSVWHQPHGNAEVLPFHPDAPDLGLQFLEDLPHDWASTHAAWNGGVYDQWVPSKGTTTMAYLTRRDIPFHYALADAFTVCDAYHCSLMGPTDPNRYHMWTGWVGNDGRGGGPVVDNAEAGYDWSTFPEKLQNAGVSWKIYQDAGVGLTAKGFWGWTNDAYIGNYGDNSLLYFHQYQNAPDNSPLARLARTGTNISSGGTLFDVFRRDIAQGKLPQVSWIVAPEAYTEHPNWPANFGAWYVAQILDALTSRPDIWSKTALFLTYDENDGFFDHMVPPTPPRTRVEGVSTISIRDEIFPGAGTYEAGPYGLGVRVPMIVVSPWSKGGWVNSQVFDHTSLIRFIERRFGPTHPGVHEPNITEWRRAVAGDLTSAFDFAAPNTALPALPSVAGYAPPDRSRHDDYKPTPPASQSVPKQEAGMRYARALPYRLEAEATVGGVDRIVTVAFKNEGSAAAVFHTRAGFQRVTPRTYTVTPHRIVSDTWQLAAANAWYDLSIYGPNGFFRRVRGGLGASRAHVEVRSAIDYDRNGVALELVNRGSSPCTVTVRDGYTRHAVTQTLVSSQGFDTYWAADATFGWYDLTVSTDGDGEYLRQFAGHIETGRDSVSDPLIGLR